MGGQILNNPPTNTKVDQKNCSIETQTMDPLLCIQLYKSTIKQLKQKDLIPLKDKNLLLHDNESTG